jgi:hypothetical protein
VTTSFTEAITSTCDSGIHPFFQRLQTLSLSVH